MNDQPLLEARKIVKSFGSVRALTGADFTAYSGEVVALVGDNGAGKSTLVKALVGVHPPDSGEIIFEGKPVEIHTPQQAREIGMETVYQDLALAEEIDPAANMFLGREIMRSGVLGKLMAVSQIASDNEAGGKTAADALAKLIGGSGKVFVVNVKPGISTTDLREKGFVAGAKAAGLTYVGREYSNDKAEVAAAKTKAALQKNPDLKGIFGTNLFSAEGAATGVREARANVKIVGFDAGPKQVKDLQDGVVQGLIAQKPADIGAQGVQQAYNALTGKPTTPKIGTESVSITKDNLSQNQDSLYKASC